MKLSLAVVSFLFATSALAQTFGDPGDLSPSRSGQGSRDNTVYGPSMRFPIRDVPSFANSQVYGRGGGEGGGGGQCDAANFSYPWHDNYCETRGRSGTSPLCPAGRRRQHEGQDIRASSCRAGRHPAVAVVSGRISNIGSYSVTLVGEDGIQYRYLHLSGVRQRVRENQRVNCGDIIGMVDNEFGGNATTVHLHFEIKRAVRNYGAIWVPPYTSLVASYRRLISGNTQCGGSVTPPPRPMPPAATGCRSSYLGRNVNNGVCVQVGKERRSGEPASCANGCGYYQCRNNKWECATEAQCGSNDIYRNGACTALGGNSCMSATLGRQVNHGTCVQTTGAGCNSGSCAWYACANGAWQCTDPAACGGERHTNPACTGTGACRSSVLGANVVNNACVQTPQAACGSDRCGWYKCTDGAWACSEFSDCGGTRHAYRGCPSTPPNRCASATTCSACNNITGCGFCRGECMPDSQAQNCGERWQGTISSCVDCTTFSNCTRCLQDAYCGWCPGSGCVNDDSEAASMCSGYQQITCP